MDKLRISVAIPASIVSDTPHLREKTSKIGFIGRGTAIFRVNEIIVYPDDQRVSQINDIKLITLLLSYMETPQYLRKQLFKLQPSLRFAGILQPLRTPHHPLNAKAENLTVGEYREGVTLHETARGRLVDIGVEHPAVLLHGEAPKNKRVTVEVMQVGKEIEVKIADPTEIRQYWGYSVTVKSDPLGRMLQDGLFDLVLATSRYGIPFADVKDKISSRLEGAKHVLVAFGAPNRGLHEIVKRERLNLDDLADFVVNTIPKQGTETIRTEEALIASLAVLHNVLFKA